jgi:hypothetical protein
LQTEAYLHDDETLKCRPLVTKEQGDQIGRLFSNWASIGSPNITKFGFLFIKQILPFLPKYTVSKTWSALGIVKLGDFCPKISGHPAKET